MKNIEELSPPPKELKTLYRNSIANQNKNMYKIYAIDDKGARYNLLNVKSESFDDKANLIDILEWMMNHIVKECQVQRINVYSIDIQRS